MLQNKTSNVVSDDNTTDSDSCSENWFNAESDEDTEEFIRNASDKVLSFETDHVALKDNEDYGLLLKYLVRLEAQRVKAVQDLNKLQKLRSEVRSDPKECLKKLINGNITNIPGRIEIEQVPNIDWSKYSKNGEPEVIKDELSLNNIDISKEEKFDCQNKVEIENPKSNSSAITVRGRVFDQSKPTTFNQLWTPEEQLRLEELLVEFPPEKNKNSRWRKIAQALGNRTTKQVCSRVQKYFKKLNKAGLPIPGRLKTSRTPFQKKRRKILKKPKAKTRLSTFFPTTHLGATEHLDSDDNRIPEISLDLKGDILKKVILYKMKDNQIAPFSHANIKCSVCLESPLQGTRWCCLSCPNVSLCSDCVIEQLNTKTPKHPPTHPLDPLTNPKVSHWDPDYIPGPSFQSSNYLDPNFVSTDVI